MHQVPAWKTLYGIAGCEDVLVADWAVVLEAFFSAYMKRQRPGHTSIAIHAMEVVDPQPFAQSAQIAIRAVVDFSVGVFTGLDSLVVKSSKLYSLLETVLNQ